MIDNRITNSIAFFNLSITFTKTAFPEYAPLISLLHLSFPATIDTKVPCKHDIADVNIGVFACTLTPLLGLKQDKDIKQEAQGESSQATIIPSLSVIGIEELHNAVARVGEEFPWKKFGDDSN